MFSVYYLLHEKIYFLQCMEIRNNIPFMSFIRQKLFCTLLQIEENYTSGHVTENRKP